MDSEYLSVKNKNNFDKWAKDPDFAETFEWNDDKKSVFCKICVKAKNTGSTFGFMKVGKSGNVQRSDFYGSAGHLTSKAHKKA